MSQISRIAIQICLYSYLCIGHVWPDHLELVLRVLRELCYEYSVTQFGPTRVETTNEATDISSLPLKYQTVEYRQHSLEKNVTVF